MTVDVPIAAVRVWVIPLSTDGDLESEHATQVRRRVLQRDIILLGVNITTSSQGTITQLHSLAASPNNASSFISAVQASAPSLGALVTLLHVSVSQVEADTSSVAATSASPSASVPNLPAKETADTRDGSILVSTGVFLGMVAALVLCMLWACGVTVSAVRRKLRQRQLRVQVAPVRHITKRSLEISHTTDSGDVP
jgi:hypothetical protein